MRISTSMIQQTGAGSLTSTQSNMYQLQQELATGRSMLSAGDNPMAAGQAITVGAAQAQNNGFTSVQTSAYNHLSLVGGAVSSVQNLLQSARQLIVQAGNTSLSGADRNSIATSLQSDYQQLLGLANSTDGNGQYLFGGFNTTSQPFTGTPSGATYHGDQGQQQVQVTTGRMMSIGVSGAELFQNVSTGNGTFVTGVGASNTGSGVIDTGTVSNYAQLTGDTYSIQFSQSGGKLQYSVHDQTTNTTVVPATNYVANAEISFDGLGVNISGTPAAGDTFSVAPSSKQDMFSGIQSAISLLTAPQAGPASTAAFTTGIGNSLKYMDNALNNVLTQQSTIGVNLQELSALKTSTATTGATLSSTLSGLVDANYAQTVSQYVAAQTAYQAAQDSYAKIAQMSLFSVIG